MSSESENLLSEYPSSAEEKQRGKMGFEKCSASRSHDSQENLASPISDTGFSSVEVLIKSETESADPLVSEHTTVENVWLPDESYVKTEAPSFEEPPDVDISVDIKPSNECIQDASLDSKLSSEYMKEMSVCEVESVSGDSWIHFEGKTREVPSGKNVHKSEGFYPCDHGQFVKRMPVVDIDNCELILSEDKDIKYSVENPDKVESEVAEPAERYLNKSYLEGQVEDVPKLFTQLPISAGKLSEQEQSKDNPENLSEEGIVEAEPSPKSSITKSVINNTKGDNTRKQYVFSICKKGFCQKEQLIAHTRVHTNEKPFNCSICKKYFSRKDGLNVHMRLHIKEKPYNCCICKKDFAYKGDLITHVKVHTKEKHLNCTICHKKFASRNCLNIHMTTHTKEKPFNCYICSKDFSCRNAIYVHMRVHTKEKPYKCSVCNKDFALKHYLKSHMGVHRKEKPFKCSVCNKDCARKQQLNIHMRVHTKDKPFSCSICSKEFSHKDSLNIHLRAHTNGKPFKCTICNKDFAEKRYLNTHTRVHTNENPLNCSICDKYFTRKNVLTKHVKRVHSI